MAITGLDLNKVDESVKAKPGNGLSTMAISIDLAIEEPIGAEIIKVISAPNDSNIPITYHYLTILFICIVLWVLPLLTFILVIDPYGVSPLQINLPRINTTKPKRIDIDRMIKPFEVWRNQPRTVFLGTSRIHQSIDPSELNGTDFAPAYNASIPASMLSENAAYLEEYFKIDKNLHYVFVEMFIYNFIFPQPDAPKRSLENFLTNTSSLLLSTDAIRDALQTIKFNQSELQIGAYVSPRGNWIRPENFNTKDTFNEQLYIDYIIKAHRVIPDMIIQPSAIQALDRIVELCQKHNAKLYLVITPSYPWEDYRLLSLGYWPLLNEWIQKLSSYENVYSFSQYNALLKEPAGSGMKWWNDPLHFSTKMGRLMLRAFQGITDPAIPANMLLPVRPDNFDVVLRERRNGLNAWASKNPGFTASFDHAKKAGGNVERRSQYKL